MASASFPSRETSERIRTLVRLRPLQDGEAGQAEALQVLSAQKVRVVDWAKRSEWSFSVDRVFDASASQEDIWKAVQTCVDKVVQGVSATIFAHGQTGTGKTHTMLGPEVTRLCGCADLKLQEASALSRSHLVKRRLQLASQVLPCLEASDERGLIPRACSRIFELLRNRKADSRASEVRVFASYVQIYNEKLVDLLAEPETKPSPLTIVQCPTNPSSSIVQGLRIFEVRSAEELLLLLLRGTLHRAFRSTRRNHMSSRSHAVFQVELRQSVEGSRSLLWHSRLNLVDLAGNERCDPRVSLSKPHLEEMGSINKSLSALILCIQQLTRAGATVSFRSSSLTRLLQNSLGGNCHTVFICTVSPSALCARESLATLRLAIRAKNVRTNPKPSAPASKEKLQQLQREVRLLRGIVSTHHEATELRVSETWNRLERQLLERALSLRSWTNSPSSATPPLAERVSRQSEKKDESVAAENISAAALLAAAALGDSSPPPQRVSPRRSASCPSPGRQTGAAPTSPQLAAGQSLWKTSVKPPETKALAAAAGQGRPRGEEPPAAAARSSSRSKGLAAASAQEEAIKEAARRRSDAPSTRVSPVKEENLFSAWTKDERDSRTATDESGEEGLYCRDTSETKSAAAGASENKSRFQWPPEDAPGFSAEADDKLPPPIGASRVCCCCASVPARQPIAKEGVATAAALEGDELQEESEMASSLRLDEPVSEEASLSDGRCASSSVCTAEDLAMREGSSAQSSSSVDSFEERKLPARRAKEREAEERGEGVIDEKAILQEVLERQRLQALQQRRLATRMRNLEKMHGVAQRQALTEESQQQPPCFSSPLPSTPSAESAFQESARLAILQLKMEKEALARHQRSLEARIQMSKRPTLGGGRRPVQTLESFSPSDDGASLVSESSRPTLAADSSWGLPGISQRGSPSSSPAENNNLCWSSSASPSPLSQCGVRAGCEDSPREVASLPFQTSPSETTRAAVVPSPAFTNAGLEALGQHAFSLAASNQEAMRASLWTRTVSAWPLLRPTFGEDCSSRAAPLREASVCWRRPLQREEEYRAERSFGESSPPSLRGAFGAAPECLVSGWALPSRRMSFSAFSPQQTSAPPPRRGLCVYPQFPAKTPVPPFQTARSFGGTPLQRGTSLVPLV